MNACTSSETVHTDIRPEVTDDESTQYTARTARETQTRHNYREPREEPAEWRETIYNDLVMKPSVLRTVETLNGVNDTEIELIKSVKFTRTRVTPLPYYA